MISVIIPTLNEAPRLAPLIGGLRAQGGGHEIIVVDGGSRDGTQAAARTLGVRVLEAGGGRGSQLACGAEAARGDILLFLHADTRFPATGLALIDDRLAASPETVGGNFRIVFEGQRPFLRWLTRFYAWIRSHGLYYGDSAVFLRRSVCEALGGVRPIPLMEDYDLTRRLEKAGPTCCVAEAPVITSARRFAGRSAPAIVWGWLKIHALYHLGMAPERLARIYDRHPGGERAPGESALTAPGRGR